MAKKTAVMPQIFSHEQLGDVRFIKNCLDDEIWFVAADVCKILGLSDTSKAVSRLDDDEADTNIIRIRSENGVMQNREVLVVNEPGLYRLIFSSRKPEAKKFQRWVYHEVLPSIRKHGYYIAPHQQIISIEGEKEFENFKAANPNLTIEIKSICLDGGFFLDGDKEEKNVVKYNFVVR